MTYNPRTARTQARAATTTGPQLNRLTSRLKVYGFLGRVAVLVLLAAIWQLLAQNDFLLDPQFVSTPLQVARSVGSVMTQHTALQAFAYTGREVLLAFVIGTAAGLLAGAAIGLSSLVREALLSPLLFVLSIPKSVFLPMFILYFGVGDTPAVAYGAFSAFFFVTANVVGGMGLVQPAELVVARAFKASTRQRLTEIVFPRAMPGIFAALWQGIHHALGGVLVVELFASSGGVGGLVQDYTNQFNAGKALATTFIVSAAAILVASAWSALERRLSRWQTEQAT